MSRAIIEAAFEQISADMEVAAGNASSAVADAEAERQGLRKPDDEKPSQKVVWERREGRWTLTYSWRWYDQSKAFSVQPDMNIMSLTLADGATIVRATEARFED